MSSRNQTQSLDREFYRRKRKNTYPQDVEKVNNAAERVACHYHKEIEEIFHKYSIKEFSEEITSDKLDNLSIRFNFDTEELLNIKSTIKQTFDNDLFDQYVDFVIESKLLFQRIYYSFSQTIKNGLIQYCVSLADYCTTEIAFVINYEKIIQNNTPDIIREINDISKLLVNFRKFTSTTKLIFYHCSDIVECVGKIRACINKLYYLITEWVDEERCYPKALSEEMKLIKSQIFTVSERIDSNKNSIQFRQAKLKNVGKHIKILMKNQLILQRKYRQIEYSQEQVDFKMKRLEDQETFRDKELVAIDKKLDNMKSKQRKTISKISPEMQSTVVEQRNLKSKQYRLDDSKIALCRHRERLFKASNDIQQKIDATEREILANKSLRSRLRTGLKEDTEIQNNDAEKLRKLQPTMDDLNFLFSKKYSPETLRQLHNHGKLILESKEFNIMDKMCERVTGTVFDGWRELYLHLPIYPSRSTEQRSNDIEIIDLISAKYDYTVVEQAKMSLNKWRLFYHKAGPTHLIEGLKKSHLNNITKDIEDLYIKSKHRYDEE